MPEGVKLKRDNRRKIEKAILRGVYNGVQDIADRICKLAINRVPVKTGNLQRSISADQNMGRTIKVQDDPAKFIQVPLHTPQVSRSAGSVSMKFGAYTPYAAYVELGTGPHIIEPNKNRTTIAGKERTNPSLRWVGQGGEVFAKRVKHPGTQPQPYMRPAVDEVRHKEFLPLMDKSISKELQDAVGEQQTKKKV